MTRYEARDLVRVWAATALWKRILAGLLLGIIAGWLLGPRAIWLQPIGDIFVRLIRMIVAPLVFLSLVDGILAISDPRQLGRIGLKFVALAFLFTSIAVVIGITLGLVFRPGVGVMLGQHAMAVLPPAPSLGGQIVGIIPTNPFEAFAKGDLLQILFAASLLAIGITACGPDVGESARPFFQKGMRVMLRITGWITELTPFGVFALIANVIAGSGFASLWRIMDLALLVHAGCLFQILVVHGAIPQLITRVGSKRLVRAMIDVGVFAYSTDSSAATLPVSLRTAEVTLGVPPTIAGTIIPLGVNFTKDGTALYVALLAIFSAQAFGVPITAANLLMTLVACTLVAVAAAPVPSGSLFILALVLDIFGLNAGQIALIVGFILPFDRPLDMMRTAVNNTVDLAICVLVAKSEAGRDPDPTAGNSPCGLN